MAESTVRACLITNPRGGRGALDLTPALPVLRAAGWEVMVRQKTGGGEAMKLARAAAEDGCTVVVDCAGDGTLNEIAAGLVGTDVAVGVLPGGTANLWANELGVDKRLRVAATQLVGAARHRVDVGCVEIDGKDRRYFLLVAGLGLDGAVMERVSKPLKRRLGPLAVGLAALKALPSFGAVPVRATLDDVPWEGRVAQVIVGNTRRYGGFTRITPDALVDNGLLDVCLITAEGLLDAGRQLGALVFEQHPSAASAETYRVARLTIEAPGPLPLQLDGGVVHQKETEADATGTTYTFSILAGALNVLVPRIYDGALFSGGSNQAGDAGQTDKGKKGLLRVVAVGADAITAARLKDGRVVAVVREPETVSRDAAGTEQPWSAFLSGLSEGDLIRVKGKYQKRKGRIRARRIRVRAAW
jgi:YegS/Rv2252/BmrU family lipid kinase